MKQRTTHRVRGLRWLLLGVFVTSLAGVSALLLSRPQAQADFAASPPSDEGVARKPGDSGLDPNNIVASGTGFRQAVSDGERLIFVLMGDRYQADRENRVVLDGVTIEVIRDEGPVRIKAARGFFNGVSEVKLEGSVVVSTERGLEIESEGLELADEGNLVVAKGTSTIRVGGLVATAPVLQADLNRDEVYLGGGVVVAGEQGEQPVRLVAENVVIERTTRTVRAQGKARLTSVGVRLEAQQFIVLLAPEEDRIEYVRALFEVVGEVRLSGSTPATGLVGHRNRAATRPVASDAATRGIAGSGPAEDVIQVRGTGLRLTLDSHGQPLDAELHGTPRRDTMARFRGARGDWTIVAPKVFVELTDGLPVRARALRRARIDAVVPPVEGKGGGAEYAAQGDRIEALFDSEGTVTNVTIDGNTRVTSQDMTAIADTAVMQPGARRVDFSSEQRVRISTASGSLEAPRVRYRQDLGLLEGEGGVTVVLSDAGAMNGLFVAAGGENEPVRVVAAQCSLIGDPRLATFRGAVRAWQGKSLLLAEQLRAEQLPNRLFGSGGIKTVVWRTERSDEQAESQVPIETTADEIEYEETSRQIRYRGNVASTQGPQTIFCESMDVDLDQDNKASRFECSGKVRIVDLLNGRRIEGDLALYDFDSETVEVTGKKVTMTDDQQGKVQGTRMRYWFSDGRLELGAAAEGR